MNLSFLETHMHSKVIFVPLLLMIVLVLAVSPALAGRAGTEGCTPGYWRQPHHYDSWVFYTPYDSYRDVFGVGPDIPLGEAIQAKGGGENALLRHSTAALLNAISTLDFGYSVANVINLTKLAFDTGDYEPIKDDFDERNNLGCRLN